MVQMSHNSHGAHLVHAQGLLHLPRLAESRDERGVGGARGLHTVGLHMSEAE